jgi:cell volume regulation protein A
MTSDIATFGWLVAGTAAVGLLAILLNRLTERIGVPAPAFVLVAAAVTAQLVPRLGDIDPRSAGRVVSVALAVILFEGGLRLGRRRARAVAGPVLLLGVAGTFLTTAGVGVLGCFGLGLGGWGALLVGSAVAPTDPAVVLAVLGRREITGPSGDVLVGESGANDPVGIALMVGLITVGGLGADALATAAGQFAMQIAIGTAGGLIGARLLDRFTSRVGLPNEALYPLRTLTGALIIFGLTTAAHGSGFLAVFLAGIELGDRPAPYKLESERFLSALAGLGEIVAFVTLGLTVDLDVLERADVWAPGIAIAAALAFLIRPLLVGACLLPIPMDRNERLFVLWAGLKGAVPILLGSYLLTAQVPDAQRLYGIVVVIVLCSVIVQGGTVGTAARLLRIPMRSTQLEPYAVGLRATTPPTGAHQITVAAGTLADGTCIGDLPGHNRTHWIGLLTRDGTILPPAADTRLHPGDRLLVLTEPEHWPTTRALFDRPAAWTTES